MEKIPLIGNLFPPITKGIQAMRDRVQEGTNETTKGIRKMFNDIRENAQAFIERKATEELNALRAANAELLIETNKVRRALEAGEVASDRSKAIIEAAEQANRALTNSEFTQVLEEENKLTQINIQALKEKSAALQKQIDIEKNPERKQELQRQLDVINAQNTALEQGAKKAEDFRRNQQAIGQAIASNNAAQSQAGVNQQLQETIKNLGGLEMGGEKAQEIFKGVLGVVEQINTETGEIEFVRPETVNQASQAGRRAELAVQATVSKVSSQLALLNDVDANISQDDIAQGLFQVFTSVEKAVSEDPEFAAQGSKIISSLLEEGAKGLGAEGNLGTIFTAAQIAELAERQTAIIEAEFKARTRSQEREVANQKLLLESNQVTAVEAAKNTAAAQAEIDAERIKSIEKRLKEIRLLNLEGSQIEKDILIELEQAQIQSDINRLNERRKIIDEELKLLQAQKDNELELFKQNNQERVNEIQILEKANKLETDVQNSRLEYYKAAQALEDTLLQNQLKFTKDAEEQAAIQLNIAQRRQQTLQVEQEFELASFEMQVELTNIGLEREAITLRIAEAELKVNKAIAQQRLLQKEQLGLTTEEEKALELQVSGLDQQIELNQELQGQIKNQQITQEEINNRQRESILLRQEAADAQSAADVEIAQIEKVLAGYEKQKEQIRLSGEEQKAISEERQLALDKEVALLDTQTKILEAQFEQVKKTQELSESYFSLAQQEAINGFRRRRLEREAAETRRKNLEQIQKIEQINLQIQQQQRDLALERKAIELDITKIDREVALANAQAELASVQADPRATAEQVRAAELGVTAQQRGIEGINQQIDLLGVERVFNNFNDQQEKLNLQQQQQLDLLNADAAVANTTLTRADDSRVSQRATINARQNANQVANLASAFSASANPFLTPTDTARFPTGPSARNLLPQAAQSSQAMNFAGNIKLTVDIKGNTQGLDTSSLETKLGEGFYKSMNELLDYSIRRQTN